MNLWRSLCFLSSFLLWIPGSLQLSCYHCNYRQIGGKEEPNTYCLDPKKHKDHIEKVACSTDKPVCSKVRATTSKYGIVMERGCFPRFPSKCKKFGTLDNEGLSDRLFEGVDANENSGGADSENKKIIFENVVGCFCDSEDECNWEPGNEMIDMKGRASDVDYGDDESFDADNSANSRRWDERIMIVVVVLPIFYLIM